MVPAKKATLTRPSGRTGVTGRADSRIVPDPKLRRWYAAAFRSVRNRPMMHGLIEVDVTEARALLGEHRVRTGESLSFTAFLIACLARSVEENKAVHALRKGRRHLVLFDSVDVYTLVERTVAGQQQPMPYVVREANRKSVRDVHQEIRAAQVQDPETSLRWLRSLPDLLFTPFLWVFTRLGRRHPQLWKSVTGTVGITAVGMFGEGAGWGIPPALPTLMVTVGGIGRKPVMTDGQVAARDYLSLTISVDHTIVDGAPAARFTRRLKDLIESHYGLPAPATLGGVQPSRRSML